MQSRRTLAALSLLALASAPVVSMSSAGAQEPPPALAPGAQRTAATSTALELDLLGQHLTVGLTEAQAAADSGARALARAVGALLPGLGLVGEENAEATADGQTSGDDQPTCGPIELPDLPAVRLSIACGTSLAAIAGGNPSTLTSASVATISVSATELLNDTPLAQLPVQETVQQVLDGLTPVFDAVGQLGLDAESLVSELLAGITQGGELLTISLGPATSSTASDAALSSGRAGAQGAVIEVIRRDLLSLPPVLTIEVGAAGASVDVDRATGVATPLVDPSLVRITVAEDIAGLLSLPQNVFDVAPDTDLCLPLPAPLASCITVAGGRVTDTADGGKRASAEGVGLRLLTGLPEGGIVLNLAATAAEAAAAAPAQPVPTTAPPTTAPPLARTGVESSLPLALALGGLGAAGLALSAAGRRRPTTTSASGI
jgi:hypothetical protein